MISAYRAWNSEHQWLVGSKVGSKDELVIVAASFLECFSTPARMLLAAMAKSRYRYNIMLRPEPEGGYTALIPALPGCVTYGRTVDEAREMAKDAISGYIASLRKHKDPIPSDDNTLVASLELEYSR